MQNNILPMPDIKNGQNLRTISAESPIMQAFFRVFNRQPDEWEISDIAFYRGKGLTDDLIVQAIRATMDAPRPSWKYTIGVLRRCMLEGCTTREGWEQRCQEHYDKVIAKQQAAERRREEWRRQREEAERIRKREASLQTSTPKNPFERDYTQREYTEEELSHLWADI